MLYLQYYFAILLQSISLHLSNQWSGVPFQLSPAQVPIGVGVRNAWKESKTPTFIW